MELQFRPARRVHVMTGGTRHHNNQRCAAYADENKIRPDKLIYCTNGLLVVDSGTRRWVVPSTMVLRLRKGVTYHVYKARHVSLRKLTLSKTFGYGPCTPVSLYRLAPSSRKLLAKLARSGNKRRNNKLQALLVDQLREAEIRKPKVWPRCLGEPADSRLACIHKYVHNNLDTPKTLQDWASELKIDTRTLHRLFVQEFGMSFVQWRQQTRLLAALEWLAEGRQVIDVALELGYQSQSAFTAMFRRNVGITPGEWQASNSCSCAERRCTACAH